MDDPFPNNTRLRKYGFKIVARPEQGYTLWELDGETWIEEDALKFLDELEDC